MNDGRLAYDPDRLPWLPNEQRPPRPAAEPRRRGRPAAIPWSLVVPWALLGLLVLAGLSYWLGMRSTRDAPLAEPAPRAAAPETRVTLPEPRAAEPMRIEAPPPVEKARRVEVAPVVARPEAQPAPPPVVRDAKPRKAAAKAERPVAERKAASPRAQHPAQARVQRRPTQLQAWPAGEVEGASGRLVRIGTFASARQAKRAWWRLMRAYPGMQRLRAVVVPVRSLRNNRTFYRLQFGTTSQAHSAVLCQRMRIIGQPCVIVG